ncbi:MAG: hypothetical protein QOH59_2456 [Gemmatimonadales bacterium]|nr:hypothetical protein [Gemmatimonadales bacterium]
MHRQLTQEERPAASTTGSGGRGTSATQVRRNLVALGRALTRRRRLRLSVRGIWLGLLVIAGGLVLRLAGYGLAWPFLIFPAAFMTMVVWIYSWSSRPALPDLVRRYDQHFALNELLSTGLEVAWQAEHAKRAPGHIGQELIEQTVRAIGALRRRVATRPLLPWSDLQVTVALVFIILGLLIPGRWSGLPDAEPIALRAIPTPATLDPAEAPRPTDAPIAATEPPAAEELSPEDAAAAEAIADALRDGGATRSAADALDRGDPSGAASDLRELADQVDQLSPEARGELADALRDAASELRPAQPDRSDRLEREADQLDGTPSDAAEALDDLAGMLDELGSGTNDLAQGEGSPGNAGGDIPGEGPEGGSEGAAGQGGGGAGQGLGGERRGGETTPPPPGGDVAPLPPAATSDGPTTAATGPRGPNVELGAGGTGTSAGGNTGGAGADTPLESDPDPLHIPPEYRDVVENYFSPAE